MDQFFVGALLGHFAVLHHQDQVGLGQGDDAVADDEGGGVAAALFQRGTDLRVGLRVHGGQGVVENQNVVVLHQRAGNGDALLLPAGEGHAALAHQRIKALVAF